MDPLLSAFIGNLKREVADKHTAIAAHTFTDLYQVGILQGEIRGLQQALDILESVIEESDH